MLTEQFVFISGRSNELKVLDFEGSQAHTFHTDFFKVLDTVKHQLLVHELRLVGVEDPLLQWLELVRDRVLTLV